MAKKNKKKQSSAAQTEQGSPAAVKKSTSNDSGKNGKNDSGKKASGKKVAHSQAFRDLKAAYDAGNYSLTQKLARDLGGMNDEERPEAEHLVALTRIDPTALAIGFAVVALVLVVGWTLLTAA